MISYKDIDEIFNKYNGVMTTAELLKNKIYYADIQKLMANGKIEKLKRGYYHLVDDNNLSEVAIINKLFPDAVICLDNALFYYGYSDRTPSEWHLAVDRDVQKSRFKIDYPFVKPHYIEPQIISIGLAEGSIDGNKIRIYDKERTICDCLKYMAKMDKELFNKAIQGYIKDNSKNIPNLIQYAKLLRVEKKVKDLIGVWL